MIIKATNIGKPKYTYGIIGLTQEEYDYILEAVNSSDNRDVDDKFDDGLSMRVFRELRDGLCE